MKINTKIKKLIPIILTAIILQLETRAQNFEWSTQIGEFYDDYGYSITTDANGNVYTAGSFVGTVDFDPGLGTSYLNSMGSQGFTPGFIQKLDANGNLLWAKAFAEIASSITLDANGNVYTTGGLDLFVQKLDANGNLLWIKRITEGTVANYASSIVTDVTGNIYITGYFQGTVDFDPGPSTHNLTSNGGADIFIQKLDANGNFLWVRQIGGDYGESGNSITIDITGYIYATGSFVGIVDFDPGSDIHNLTSKNFPSNINSDIFILKLDINGNFLWAKQIGGASLYGGKSITTDIVGSVYVTGDFQGTVDFDPGSDINNLTSNGSSDIFIQKLDGGGNLVWVKQIGGTFDDYVYSHITDANGNIYTIGTFKGTIDIDPGSGIYNLTSTNFPSSHEADIFIQKLDVNGNLLWVKQIGGIDQDVGYSITIDINGYVCATGVFKGTINFDSYSLTSKGWYDIFILKLNQNPTSVSETIAKANKVIYPNPNNGKFTVKTPSANNESVKIIVTDMFGRQVKETTAASNGETVIKLDAPGGIYFVTVATAEGRHTEKIIIQ